MALYNNSHNLARIGEVREYNRDYTTHQLHLTCGTQGKLALTK
jgi:hypothetical protein